MDNGNKIDAILQHVQEIKVEQARYLMQLQQHRKELDAANGKIEKLEANQNKAIGVIGISSAAIAAFFSSIFK